MPHTAQALLDVAERWIVPFETTLAQSARGSFSVHPANDLTDDTRQAITRAARSLIKNQPPHYRIQDRPSAAHHRGTTHDHRDRQQQH